MKTINMKITSPKAIGDTIRSSFAFLLSHGYAEVPVSPPSDECYAEVQFKKNDWRIAVLTTAHGTRITLVLVSPDGERGFLSHLADREPGADLLDDIRVQALFLQEHGLALLQGSVHDFKSVLETITERQLKWVAESGIAQQVN
jgi:hypothetical protein